MNFMEAVKAMKEGKKVRKSSWASYHYIYCPIPVVIIDEDKQNPSINLDEYETTDWEIVEKKKTLSEKLYRESEQSNVAYSQRRNIDLEIASKLFEEAIKEFIDWLKNLGYWGDITEEKAKEIFGERLIK